jgi:glutathione S-transferase
MEIPTNAILKIYGDEISQPVRSVLLFCDLNKIPYTYVKISLAKGEQYQNEELKKVNPNLKVPAISYSDSKVQNFYLSESCSILRFLADTYKVDEFWYNRKNPFRRALIEQNLDWHHLNTRYVFYYAIIKQIMAPNMLKMGGELAERAKTLPDTINQIPKILKHLDKLLGKQKFIVDNEMSIVDLIYSQEIDQIRILGIDLKKYENLWAYLNNINSTPEGIKVNKVTEKLIEKANEKRKKMNPKF